MAKGDELQKVGRTVAARRGELDMTQQDLADAAGVDLKTVYNLESGTRWPIARTRVAISRALGWGGDGLARIVAAAGYETQQPAALPLGLEETARAYGADPADPNNPLIRAVRREVERAEDAYGEGVTGIQIFHGQAAAEIEAMIWDDPRVAREAKIVAIAMLRAHRALDVAGRSGGSRPAAGLTPRLTVAGRR